MSLEVANCRRPTPGQSIEQLAAEVMRLADENELSLAVAEGCTGGLLSGLLTSVDAHSHRFECGFITYTSKSKTEMIDVPPVLLDLEGPVTAPIAKVMAKGAQIRAQADIALAITDFEASASSPDEIGLVHIATCDRRGRLSHCEHRFQRGQTEIRQAAAFAALILLKIQLENWAGSGELLEEAPFLLSKGMAGEF